MCAVHLEVGQRDLMPKRPPMHEPSYTGRRQTERERKSSFDRNRGTRTQRGYSNKWLRAAKSFLRTNPLCNHCDARGVITPATEVDHITPHRGDMHLFWDTDNWQPLCKQCHSAKTAREKNNDI